MASDLNIIIEQANSAIISRDYSFAERILLNSLKKISKENSEKSIKFKNLLGKLYIRSGDLEKGLKIYQNLDKINKNDIEILNNLGVIYRRLKKFNSSVSVLERAKHLDTSNETTLYNLGNTYKQKGDYENAAKCFIDVLDKKPDDVLAYNHLGSIYSLEENYDAAIDSYKKGLRIDPNHPFLNFNIGLLYKDKKNYRDAIFFLKKALKTKPNWQDALSAIAKCYIQEDSIEKAIEVYKSTIEENENPEKIFTKIASLYQKLGNSNDAEKYYKKALKINEYFLSAILSYSALLKTQNRYFDAYSILSKGMEKNFNNKELLLDISDVCLLLENYTKVKEILKILTAKWANDFQVLKLEGKLFSVLGETKKSEIIFEKLLRISPNEITLRLELADLYAHNDKYKLAISEYQKYLKEKPQDINARLKLGAAYEAIEDYNNALNEYNKIIKNDSKNRYALEAILELNKKQGNDVEAVRLANEIVDISVENADDDDLNALSDSLQLYESAVNKYDNDSLLNKNIDHFKESNEPLDITPQEIDETSFIENNNNIEEDEFYLTESLDDPSDLEMPFDDLMELANQEEFEDPPEDDMYDLLTFDAPINDEPSLYGNMAEDDNAFSKKPKQNDYIPEDELQLPEISASQNPPTPKYSPQEQSIEISGNEPEPTNSVSEPISNSNSVPNSSRENSPTKPQEQPKSSKKAESKGNEDKSSSTPKDIDNFLSNNDKEDIDSQDMGAYNEIQKEMDETIEILNETANSINDLSDNLTSKMKKMANDSKKISEQKDRNSMLSKTGAETKIVERLEDNGNLVSDTNFEETVNSQYKKYQALDLIPKKLKSQKEFEAELEKINPEEMISLFSYLRDLMKNLPFPDLKDFLISDERMQMEYVIKKLSGKIGFKNKGILLNVKTTLKKTVNPKNTTEKTLKDTLGYLRIVASQLPDKDFADSCVLKIDKILEQFNE